MPPFAWGEVVQLSVVVSQAVAAGLPRIKGAETRALIVVIGGMLETLIIMGVEAAYQLVVNRT